MGNVNKSPSKYSNGDTSQSSNSVINNAENDRLKIITSSENRRNESSLHSKVRTEYGAIVLNDDNNNNNNNNDQTDNKNFCNDLSSDVCRNGSVINYHQNDDVCVEVIESCGGSEKIISSVSKNNSNREMLITDQKEQSEHERPNDVSTSQHTSVWAVELMFLLYKIAESILEPTVRLYLYESVCLNLYPKNNHHYICEHLKFDLEKEHEVQSNAARYMVYYKILINFPAMVVVLCCGAWSDSSGRTTPIILTCLGTVLAVLAYMTSSIDAFNGTPSLPVILLGAGIRGVFGRSAIMTMAVNSYVSDNSHVDRRTQRLSNLAAMSHFGYLLGSSSAGFLLDKCGFSTVFLIVIVIDTACVLVAYGCMRDRINDESSIFDNMLHGRESPEEVKPLIPGTPLRPSSKSHRCQTISASEDFIIIQIPAEDGDTPINTQKTSTRSRKIDVMERNEFSTMSLPIYKIESNTGNESEITNVARTTRRSVKLPCSRSCDTLSESVDENNINKDAIKLSTDDVFNKSTKDVTQDVSNAVHKEIKVSEHPTKSVSITRSLFGSFKVLFRHRDGRLRYNIWALFAIIYLHQMNKSGDQDIYLLFTKRTPLSVTRSLYGYLLSANYAFLGLFAFFIPKFFNCINFHAKDSTLAITGVSFRIISLVILFLSDNVWMLVIAAVLSGPHSLAVSTVKSMVSKIVESGEMGKTFSLMSSGETLSNLLGTLIYTSIYSVTSQIHPGICFLIEAGVYCIIILIITEMTLDARGVSLCTCNSPCDKNVPKTKERYVEEEDISNDDDRNADGDELFNANTPAYRRATGPAVLNPFDRTPQDAQSQAIFTTPHN